MTLSCGPALFKIIRWTKKTEKYIEIDIVNVIINRKTAHKKMVKSDRRLSPK